MVSSRTPPAAFSAAPDGTQYLSVSREWPSNLPDPTRHSPIRVSGMYDWIRGLSSSDQVFLIRFLINHDVPSQGTTYPSLFDVPYDTMRLAQVYDMVGVAERERFVTMIRWLGKVDDQPVPTFPPAAANGEGQYCYADLFTTAGAGPAKVALGSNPWAPALAAYLLEHAGEWASGKFSFELGSSPGTGGTQAFAQAHVRKGGYLTIRQLIPLLGGTVRVGSALPELNALLNLNATESAPGQKTVYDLAPTGVSHEIDIGLFAIIGTNQIKYPNFSWTIFSTPALVVLLGIYESVRLESLEFVVRVDEGSGNALDCGIAAQGISVPTTWLDWLRLPIYNRIQGSDTGVVSGSFVLPKNHPFATEMKRSVQLGTAAPILFFGFTGAADAKATISGKMRVHVAGIAPFGKINIGGSGGAKLRDVTKITSSIQASIGWVEHGTPISGDDAPEEESDDEEEAAPARGSPPARGPRAD